MMIVTFIELFDSDPRESLEMGEPVWSLFSFGLCEHFLIVNPLVAKIVLALIFFLDLWNGKLLRLFDITLLDYFLVEFFSNWAECFSIRIKVLKLGSFSFVLELQVIQIVDLLDILVIDAKIGSNITFDRSPPWSKQKINMTKNRADFWSLSIQTIHIKRALFERLDKNINLIVLFNHIKEINLESTHNLIFGICEVI